MTDDSAMYAWLLNLARYGMCLVKNVPVEEGHVPVLQERVAFQKLTHYG